MAAHIGITGTYGIALDDEAIPQTVRRRRSVEISAVIGVDGEYVRAKPLKMVRTEVTITGVGNGDRTAVTVGAVADPADLEIVSVEQSESSKGRASFTLTAAGMSAHADGAGNSSGAAATIERGTIEIVSVAYLLTETVSLTTQVEDKTEPDSDGTPGVRAKHARMSNFSLRGKGDLPAGLALGTGGAAVSGLNGGVLLVSDLEEGEAADQFNDWSVTGNHYPAAAAG